MSAIRIIDDHLELASIGSNSHAQIDTHISTSSIHQTKYTDAEAKAAAEFHDGGEAEGANRTLGNTDNYSLGFKTNNVTRLKIRNDGNVGIGTEPDAKHKFKLGGSFIIGTLGTSYSISGYISTSQGDWYALTPNVYVIPYAGWKYLDNGFGGIIQFARPPSGDPLPYWAFLTTPNNTGGADAAVSSFTTAVRIYRDSRVMIGSAIPTAALDIVNGNIRLRTAKTPASAGATGNQGDWCWDSNYVYVCVATNTWKRSAISTW